MTAADVLATLAEIRREAHDPEGAHCLEDELHRNVLAEVASRGGDLGEMASLALTSQEISFSRWYA